MTAIIAQQNQVSMPAKPKISKKFKLRDLLDSSNIAKDLDKDLRASIGRWVIGGYVKDLSTRSQWATRHANAMRIALQVKEVKNFPWPNASNVKFPLVTIGALQFLARISILTKGEHLASFHIMGKDPDGLKTQRAARISDHINYQLTDETPGWADLDEQTKFAASILGSSFKKTYYDPVSGKNISDFVPAQNFVVDYACKDLETCRRFTHCIPMDPNKIQERVTRGIFLEEPSTSATRSSTDPAINVLKQAANESQGLAPEADSEEQLLLEQYAWLDFDGDGYEEPYIITVRADTGHVYRIVARYFDDGSIHRKFDARERQFEQLSQQVDDPAEKSKLERRAIEVHNSADNSVVRIDPINFFTKYTFVPSPDGGFYGLGLGALLGPVNEAVDSLINQLIDAGTMSNTGGGWIARGAKMQAGKTSFDPFEWKRVDSTGDDLRKSIFPLPVREPSMVLFNLLGILITYGEKISSATDIMTGMNPGQNTPATTAQTTVEQGMMLFSGIYTRIYRAFREEISIFFKLNKIYLRSSPRFWELTQGPDAILQADDYTGGGLKARPTADPSAISGQQRRDKANRLVQASMTPLGAKWDKDVISRKWLEAEEWNIDEIFPDPKGPRAIQPPVDPKMQVEQAKLQQAAQQHHDEMMLEVAKMQQTVALNRGKILEMRAKAAKLMAEAGGEQTKEQIALINAQIGAAKLHNDTILRGAGMMLNGFKARTDIEHKHHQMLMDLHDRITQEEAADRENLTAGSADSGQNSTSTNGGGVAA